VYERLLGLCGSIQRLWIHLVGLAEVLATGVAMRRSLTGLNIVRALVVVFVLALGVRDVSAAECINSEIVLTSQVAVQVFGGRPLEPWKGVDVSLIWERAERERKSDPTAAGQTDPQGHLQILEVPPGFYRLVVRSSLWYAYACVRVVPSANAPPRLITISPSGGWCPAVCTVTGTVGPLAQAPKCLVQKQAYP
jgi:hypothetical protein